MIPDTIPFDFLERNTEHISPIGTPITIAPNVPKIEVRMIGSIPYNGFVLFAGSHSVPNRKSNSPISEIAGMPETIR